VDRELNEPRELAGELEIELVGEFVPNEEELTFSVNDCKIRVQNIFLKIITCDKEF
jgi:hypothetical protein